jgi:hypothetical protein
MKRIHVLPENAVFVPIPIVWTSCNQFQRLMEKIRKVSFPIDTIDSDGDDCIMKVVNIDDITKIIQDIKKRV